MINNCPFDIQPYAESNNIIVPSIFNLNYTNQDYWSMKTRLVDFIKQNFSKDFSDFVESSLGIMLIENWAFIADTLSFKMDQIANEVFIDTVTELENAFRLAKLVGFQPQPPIAASSLWTATLNNQILSDLEIPTPFGIQVGAGSVNLNIELFAADADNNPIFDQNIIIPAGNIVNASIVGLEGQTRTQEEVGSGAIGQTITLPSGPVIYDSIRVSVDGVKWDRVDYFTDSKPRREFRVEFDSNYNAFVVFGNNRAGLLPSNGSRIVVTYRTGGGSIGNIISNTVTKQTVINIVGIEYPIPVSFSNYTRGQYGYDGDTIDDIKNKLPKWIRTQQRAVTGLDYKTLTDQFATPYQGQIGKSAAVLRNHGCSGNIVDIYILALDGTDKLSEASDQLKIELTNYLEQIKMFTDFICIKNGIVINVDVSLDLVLDRFYKKFENEIKVKVERRINQFFALAKWDYHQDLRDNDLTKVLSDLKEIKRIDLTFTTNDINNSGNTVTTKFYEIIRPDVIDISFTYE